MILFFSFKSIETKVVGPQLKFLWQLFTKNTAPCELVRGCIGGDA